MGSRRMASVVRLDITGMMCDKSCTPAVEKAIREVPGVENVNVSLEGKCAWVSGSAPTDDLIAAVNGAGGCGKFTAKMWEESESSVVRINISGMMCTKSCTPTVQAALLQVPGVESANVSLESKAAWIKGTAAPEALVAAVNAA